MEIGIKLRVFWEL